MVFPTDAIYFIGSYLLVLIGGFFLINWLSAGVIKTFMKVKSSRGRLVLIKLHTKLRTYVSTGWLEGDDLVYFDKESKENKQKVPKRISSPGRDCFYRFMGLWTCDIDEATNNLIKPDGSIKEGYDAIRWNNLYLRALMKPAPQEKDRIFIIIICIMLFIVLILGIVTLVKTGQLSSQITALKSIGSSAIKGGNI
jgi:hypothetical protein